MAITKPPVLPAWAESGDKVTPSNAEIQVGWPLSSIPPSRQRFNWLLNFLANGIRYFSRRGLPDYDAAETYMTGDRIIGDDGKTYLSLIDNNTAKTPSTSPTKWEEWAPTLSRFAALIQGQTYTAFTTTGDAPNFTLTPSPAIAAYAAGQRFRVKFHAAGTGADVLKVSALGNKSLKQYDSTGAKVAAVIAASQLADVEYDGVDMVIMDPLPPAVSVGLPRQYLSGLTTATNAGAATTKIDIAAGSCRSDDNTSDIVIAATITKQLNAAWVAGSKGGLDTGAVAANTGYHIFAIYNPTTSVSDVLFSTSYAAPNMPGGFTKKRWIGWIRTNGSKLIKPYFQRGDIFMWKTPGLDVNGSALSAGDGANYALPVPSGLVVQAMVNVQCSGPDAGCYVHSPETDAMYPETTPTTTPPLSMLSWTSSNPEMSAGSLIIPTDTSASIRVDSTSNWTETIYIGTLGWISNRGRND